MEKWAIRPDPSAFDPHRHILLVKGNMKDISVILKRFGSFCGRPAPTSNAEGFNFSLFLHGMTQIGIEKMSAALNDISVGAAAPAFAPLPGRERTPPPMPGALEPMFPTAPPATPPPAPLRSATPPPAPLTPATPPPMPVFSQAPAALPPAPADLPAPSEFPALPELPIPGAPGVLPPAATPQPAVPPELPAAPEFPALPELPVPAAPGGLPPPPALPELPALPAFGALPTAPPPAIEPFIAPPAAGLGEAPMDKAALPSEPSELKKAEAALPPPPELPSPPALTPPPAAQPQQPPTPLPALAPAPTPMPAPIPVPMPTPMPTPVLAPVLSAPPPTLSAPAGVMPGAAPAAARALWGLAAEVDAKKNFDSMKVGPYNRFAHAAATSVVGSPGSMYNPLFLYGAGTTGKSHIAHAIANGLVTPLTKEGIILTTGARLSRAVSAALAENRFTEIETYLSERKALIVDDIHLLAVTEANRASLARVFELFFGKNLQVVLTSLYPPRALGALEEALKISLSKGWSVDLKVPSPTVQGQLIQDFLDGFSLGIEGDFIKSFQAKLGPNHAEWQRFAQRLVAMIKLGQTGGTPPNVEEMINTIFIPGVPEGGAEMPQQSDLDAIRNFVPPNPAATALNFAVFIPKGHENLGPWVAARFHEASKQFAMPLSYRQVLRETYDAGQPFGVPFQLGEWCRKAGAQVAIVVGPPADSPLAARVGEFTHAVGHVLESGDVVMGWIPHNGTMSAHNFLRVHLDFMAARS